MNEFNVEDLGLKLCGVAEEGGGFVVEVTDASVEETPPCAFCGASTIRFGARKARYRDLPVDGRPVQIAWKRQRFRCSHTHPVVGRAECGRIFSPPNLAMDERRFMTVRLAEHIGQQSLVKPFLTIASEVGVDDQTVRQAFTEWSARNTVSASMAAVPKHLAITSMDILKKARPVLADIDEETLLDILPSEDAGKLLDCLSELRDPKAVETIVVDLRPGYVEAARKAFPTAEVAINVEHLQRIFDDAFENELLRIRRSLPDRMRRSVLNDPNIMRLSTRQLDGEQLVVLRYWFERLPALEDVFAAREKFVDFLEAGDRQSAASALDNWQRTAASFAQTPLGPLYPMVETRRDEMLNSKSIKTSPSFGALLSALQEAVREDSNGQAFDVRRAKLLTGPSVKANGRIRSKGSKADWPGVHLPTLIAEFRTLSN